MTTPYLNDIGGTEIETITSAVILWDTGNFDKISVFSPKRGNSDLFKDIIGHRPIYFKYYPKYLQFHVFKLLTIFFKKIGFKLNIFHFLYWKYNICFFNYFYIITNTRNDYFFPLIVNKVVNKKAFLKLTMYHFESISLLKQSKFENFSAIILFNEIQKRFWEDKYGFRNIVALDITIPNETNLLNLKITNSQGLVFGYLGRISLEKNIEEMILLIDNLINRFDVNCSLIIQGEGDYNYENKLIELIQSLKLENHITFINSFLSPMETHNFFSKIDVFLVLSIHEGGPITSLEASAAGRIVIGYDVGAMMDRFSKFPYSINKNFEVLCENAYKLACLNIEERMELSQAFKDHYSENLNNFIKTKYLLKIFNESSI